MTIDLNDKNSNSSLPEPEKSSPNPFVMKVKPESRFAFFAKMSEKEQRQFIARTTDMLMQSPLFADLSPKPIPSRDQIMTMMREYVLENLNVK
jgi:hypothetical protein